MSQGLTIYPSPRTTGKYAKNVWDLQLFDGKIYIGQGNSSNYGLEQNAGPIPAYSLNPDDGLYTNEFTIDEEQIDVFRVLNGDLYIPGHDPLESWALGNFYRKSIGGNWVKKRTIPNGVHTYDMEYFDGKLFAALGVGGSSSHKSRAVSFDMGETWVELETSDNNRTWSCFVFNNEVYFLGYAYYIDVMTPGYLLKYIEGENVLEQTVNNKYFIPLGYISTQPGAKLKSGSVINFNGYLIYILGDAYNDHQIYHRKLCKTNDLTQHASHVDFPELNYIPTDLLVRGVNLYVIGHVHSNGRYINIIYKTTNLSIWEEEVRYDTLYIFAMSFEELNGDFYLGMGTYEREYTYKIPENNGDIVKLESTYEYITLSDPPPLYDDSPPDDSPPDDSPLYDSPLYDPPLYEGGYLMLKTFRNQKLLSSDIVKDSYNKINENSEDINVDLISIFNQLDHISHSEEILKNTMPFRSVQDSISSYLDFECRGVTLTNVLSNGQNVPNLEARTFQSATDVTYYDSCNRAFIIGDDTLKTVTNNTGRTQDMMIIPVTKTSYSEMTTSQLSIAITEYFENIHAPSSLSILSRRRNLFNIKEGNILPARLNTDGSITLDESVVTINQITPSTSSINFTTTTSFRSIVINYTLIKPNTIYTMFIDGPRDPSVNNNVMFLDRIVTYDINKQVKEIITLPGATFKNLRTMTFNSGEASYVRVKIGPISGFGTYTVDNIRLVEGESVLEYSNYESTKVDILLTNPSKFYLHKLSNGLSNSIKSSRGSLIAFKNIEEYILKSEDITNFINATNTQRVDIPLSSLVGLNHQETSFNDYEVILSNGFPEKNIFNSASDLCTFYTSNGLLTISFPLLTFADLTEAKNALTGLKVVYRLLTPEVIDEIDFPEYGISINGNISSFEEFSEFIVCDYDILPSDIKITYKTDVRKLIQGIKNNIGNV